MTEGDAQATAAYHAALASLFARTGGGSRYGLERTRRLLAALGDPHDAVPAFHVAGTNGKGSTVATLVALLRARGLRVGAYTSPHLVDFRERIVIDGRAIAPERVTDFIERHAELVDEVGASFFEVTTALAFDHFARGGADVAVIETGLGGRLDSTNVVRPLVAGVTSIGFDHTALLGNTLDAIAAEKAGIYKRGAAAVVGEHDATLRAVLADHARAHGANRIDVVSERAHLSGVRVDAEGTHFRIEAPWGGGRMATTLSTPLVGAFQARNVATALAMLDAAGDGYRPVVRDLAAALRTVRLPGRMQRVGRHLFDVAHNPDGMRALGDALVQYAPNVRATALLAVLADKDWRTMLDALAPHVARVVATVAPSAPPDRVWSLAEVADHARSRGHAVDVVHDFDAALARADADGDMTVVTGSFHTVGDAMLRLQVDPLAG